METDLLEAESRIEAWGTVLSFIDSCCDYEHRTTWHLVRMDALTGIMQLAESRRSAGLLRQARQAEAEVARRVGIDVEDLRDLVDSLICSRRNKKRTQMPARIVGQMLSLSSDAVRTRVHRVRAKLGVHFGGGGQAA